MSHRKKRDQRRHTVNNPKETAQQVEIASAIAATTSSPSNSLSGGGTNGEREGFVNSPSSSDPTVKATITRKISSKFNECLFLRYGPAMRRCPMPSPITITTIKNLFVNMFDLSPSVLENKTLWQVFILDRANSWRPLEKASMVHDHCTLLLVNPSDLAASPELSCSPTQSPDSVTSPTPFVTPELLDTTENNTQPKLNGLWLHCHGVTPVQADDYRQQHEKNESKEDREGEDTQSVHLSQSSSLQPTGSNPNISCSTSESKPTSGVSSGVVTTLGILTTGHTLCKNLNQLKGELAAMRSEHLLRAAEFQSDMVVTRGNITGAIASYVRDQGAKCSDKQSFRHQRLVIDPVKESYTHSSQQVFNDLNVLQLLVEEMRIDAVERRCRVKIEDVESLAPAVEATLNNLVRLRAHYSSLEMSLKEVMKRELEVIVGEEKFTEKEKGRLEDALESCKTLAQTLKTLLQFSTIQDKRPLMVPVINSIQAQEKKAHMAVVMESVGAICPNHDTRLQAINTSELIQMRKKQLRTFKRDIWWFEGQLQARREQLRPTSYVKSIDRQRQMKLKAMFMDEKIKEEMGQDRIKRLVEEKRKKQSQTAEQRRENEQRVKQRNKEEEEAKRQTQPLEADGGTHRKEEKLTRRGEQKKMDVGEDLEPWLTEESRRRQQTEEDKKKKEEERRQTAEKRRVERRQERERRWQEVEEEVRREANEKKRQKGYSGRMEEEPAKADERRKQLQTKENKLSKEEEQRWAPEKGRQLITEGEKRREKSQEGEELQRLQHQAEEELKHMNEERKRQVRAEKERRRVDEIRQLEEQRFALEEERRQIEEEKQRIQEQQQKQEEDRRLAEQEMWLQREKRQQWPQWGVREGSESPTSMEQRREQLWQQIQQQVQHELDEERMWQQQQQQLNRRLVHAYDPLHARVGQWGAMAPFPLHETRLPERGRKCLGYLGDAHGVDSYGVSHHAPFVPYTTEGTHHQISPVYRTASSKEFRPPLQRSNSEESLILLRQSYSSHKSRSPTVLMSPRRAAPSKKLTVPGSQNRELHSPKPHQQKQWRSSETNDQPAFTGFHHTYTAQLPSSKQKPEGKGGEPTRVLPVGTSSLPRSPYRHRQRPPQEASSSSSNNTSTQSTPSIPRNLAFTANAQSDNMDSNWHLPSNRTSYPRNPVQIPVGGGMPSLHYRTSAVNTPQSRHRQISDNSSRITHYPHHASGILLPQPKTISQSQPQPQSDSQSQSISYV